MGEAKICNPGHPAICIELAGLGSQEQAKKKKEAHGSWEFVEEGWDRLGCSSMLNNREVERE